MKEDKQIFTLRCKKCGAELIITCRVLDGKYLQCPCCGGRVFTTVMENECL